MKSLFVSRKGVSLAMAALLGWGGVGEVLAADVETATLDKIVVSATKTPHTLGDVPVAAEVITREELQERNVKTLQEALERIPSLKVHSTAGYNNRGLVSLQGLDPRHTLVLIDGQRVQGGHENAMDIQQVSIDMIERIEVVKGPASALYGSEAVGGVINIITRGASKTPEFSGSLGMGSRGTMVGTVSAGAGSEHIGGHVSYTYRESEGLDLTEGDDPPTYDDYYEHILQGALSFDLSDNTELSIRPYYSYQVATDTAPELSQERYGVNTLFKWEPDDLSNVTLRGSYFSYHNLTQEDPTDTDTILSNTEFEASYSRLLLNTHLVTAGYQYWLDDRDSESQDLFVDQETHSVYMQDEIDLSPVVLVLGGRLDMHENWGEEFNPRAALMYKATDKLTFRTSIGTAFKAPSLLKIYGFRHVPMIAVGNPDLKPETSVGYQAGVDYQFCEGVRIGVSGFRNDIEDLIKTEVNFPFMTFSNVEEAMTQGVELNLEGCLNDDISATLGYSYLDTENKLTGKELTQRPDHRLTAGIDVKLPSADTSLRFETFYTGERWNDDDNTEKLDDYWIFNASATKEIGEHAEVFVKVDNVFDKKDVEDEDYVIGREFFAGVRMNL